MASDNPLVSILIPVYNREKLVIQAIESACKQTYTNIEVIVVDNQSTDNTWPIISAFAKNEPRVKVFQNRENWGPVKNWQECLRHSNGKYSNFLFSDDLISNNFIESCLEAFDEETAFVLSPVYAIKDESAKVLAKSIFQNISNYSTEFYLNDVLLYNRFDFPNSPGCAVFRTEDANSSLMLDIYNEEDLDFKKLGAGNDLLLYLIAASKYRYIKIAVNCRAYFRHHTESITVQNNLRKYYEWAKLYFIRNYKPELLRLFTTKIFYQSKKQPSLICLMNHLETSDIDWFVRSQYIITRFKSRLTNIYHRISNLIFR